MLHIVFLERKNQKKRFFLSKSMPNFNFAKVHLQLLFRRWDILDKVIKNSFDADAVGFRIEVGNNAMS
jgi:hypothetical protein